MEPRISLITLAVADVARTRAFYVDGLGWRPIHDDADIVMLPLGSHLVLSLWHVDAFADEVGAPMAGGIPPVTLAHNVRTRDEVDAVLAEVARLGAPVEPGRQREWGGYSGYFTDPDGFRWEVAENPALFGDGLLG